MEDKNNNGEVKGADEASIFFGIFNLILVAIFYLVKKAFVGGGVALFFMLGFYAAFHAIKNGIKEKDFKGLGKGILGMILNIAALGLLVLFIIRIFIK
jgi:hypothetical protein